MKLLYSAGILLVAFIIVQHIDSGASEPDPVDYGTMSDDMRDELDQTWCVECRMKQQQGMRIGCGGCPGGSSSGSPSDDDDDDAAPPPEPEPEKKMSGRGFGRPKSDKKMGGRSLKKGGGSAWCKSCLAKQRKGMRIGCDGCGGGGGGGSMGKNDDWCMSCKAKQKRGFKIACPDCDDDDFCSTCKAKQRKGLKIACPDC